MHYLDHASTTDLRPEAAQEWLRVAAQTGNASSTHGAGQRARRILEESRERLAAVLGCDPIEVVFTSGGTEAVNLGDPGAVALRVPHGADAIVLPDGEHHATLDTVAALAAEGARVRSVPLDAVGRIPVPGFAAALTGGGDRAPGPSRSRPRWWRTTRSARSTTHPRSPRPPRARPCRCTSTRSPRSARCGSRSPSSAGMPDPASASWR